MSAQPGAGLGLKAKELGELGEARLDVLLALLLLDRSPGWVEAVRASRAGAYATSLDACLPGCLPPCAPCIPCEPVSLDA